MNRSEVETYIKIYKHWWSDSYKDILPSDIYTSKAYFIMTLNANDEKTINKINDFLSCYISWITDHNEHVSGDDAGDAVVDWILSKVNYKK